MAKNDDFLGGAFDLNGDGNTDLGEEFMAYQSYKAFGEVDDDNHDHPATHRKNPGQGSGYRHSVKLEWWYVALGLLLLYQLMSAIASLHYR